MREVLFKAKCKEEPNDWVEGYLSKCEREFIISNDEGVGIFINPDTICQYTGLTDKNGKKIWENDVVYIPYERLEDSYCKVIFRRGGFIGEMADGCEDCLLNRKIEIIGNIFDNPELLKGE